MALYAFFLAGSNYFAPVICGFIADRQGWQWVFYWPSIFLGVAFVFLFFFMEETNYDRGLVGVIESMSPDSGASAVLDEEASASKEDTKEDTKTTDKIESDHGTVWGAEKTFWQKLALKDAPKPKNLMLARAWQGLSFLSWPVVFYAGYDLTSPSCRSSH